MRHRLFRLTTPRSAAVGLPLLVVEGGAVVADGTVRNAATGRAADGRRLDLVPVKRLYAFAWQADHSPDALLTTRPSGRSSTAGAGVVRFYHAPVCN